MYEPYVKLSERDVGHVRARYIGDKRAVEICLKGKLDYDGVATEAIRNRIKIHQLVTAIGAQRDDANPGDISALLAARLAVAGDWNDVWRPVVRELLATDFDPLSDEPVAAALRRRATIERDRESLRRDQAVDWLERHLTINGYADAGRERPLLALLTAMRASHKGQRHLVDFTPDEFCVVVDRLAGDSTHPAWRSVILPLVDNRTI